MIANPCMRTDVRVGQCLVRYAPEAAAIGGSAVCSCSTTWRLLLARQVARIRQEQATIFTSKARTNRGYFMVSAAKIAVGVLAWARIIGQ